MKVVFRIASFNIVGELKLLPKEYSTYEEAEKAITHNCMDGVYQIQKVFVKATSHDLNNEPPF